MTDGSPLKAPKFAEDRFLGVLLAELGELEALSLLPSGEGGGQ